MLVKVNVPLKTMDGHVMKDNIEGKAIDAVVKMAIVNGLLAPVESDKGVEKMVKYELAKRVYTNDEVDLNENDIKLIKDCVGVNYAPIIVGQVYDLLKV